jgi:perosamine synthetase
MTATRTKKSSDSIPVSEPLLEGNELEYVQDCIRSGWISGSGPYVERFERNWADYCGMQHGVAVSSGTAALQIAVDALGLGPGDEVIIPSFTIISCALAVIRAGATPILVDCDPETYCIDVDQVSAAITTRTRAIMPVHIFGHAADMEGLLELASRHGLAVIEDAAQAHGAECLLRNAGRPEWRRCGGLGTVSVFSFYANKLVTTGEGGMVLTNSPLLAEKCRSLRNLCFQSNRFEHEELGYNFRLTNMQAAIGVAQIERIDDALTRKRRIGSWYDGALKSVKGIKTPTTKEWARTSHWMYAVVLDDDLCMGASEFANRLADFGVQSRPLFMGMHEQPALRARGLFAGLRFPVTERLHQKGLYLPSGLGLERGQIETIARAIGRILS